MRKLTSLALLLVAFAVGGCSVDTYGKGGFRVDSPLLPRHGQPYASGPAAVSPGPSSTVGPGQPLMSGPQYAVPPGAMPPTMAAPGGPRPGEITVSKQTVADLLARGCRPRSTYTDPNGGVHNLGWTCPEGVVPGAVASSSASASASASAVARAVAPAPKPKPMRPKAKVGKGSPQPPQPGCKVYGLPSGGQAKGECKVIIGQETVAGQQVPPLDLKPAPATPSPSAEKSPRSDDKNLAQKLKEIFKN